MASKGFLPMDEFIRLKRTNKKAKDNNDKPASGLNNIHVY